MTRTRAAIDLSRERIADLCRRRNICWLALFGSVLRDDFGPDSDVDVVVEFSPGTRYTLFTLSEIEEELSPLLGNRSVDLHVRRSLHPYVRDKVLEQAQPIYVGT